MSRPKINSLNKQIKEMSLEQLQQSIDNIQLKILEQRLNHSSMFGEDSVLSAFIQCRDELGQELQRRQLSR